MHIPLNTKSFVEKSQEIHQNKYDYSLTIYEKIHNKVKIICPVHGIFEKSPDKHLYANQGCPKCSDLNTANKNRLSKESFIKRSNIIHNHSYDYSLVDYINARTNVRIICIKHGEFNQKPQHHLNGSGCPNCKSSSGENKIKEFLYKNNIKFESQKKFDDCRYKKILSFDIFIEDYNLCIEFDGIQHFKPLELFGGIDAFEETLLRDEIKNEYCRKNDIRLIRIPYHSIDNIQSILSFLE